MVDVFKPKIKGRRSVYYYGKLRDPETKKWRKVSLGVTDKQVAREKLRQLRQRTERFAWGLESPAQDALLLDLVVAFLHHLTQQARSQAYRQQTECEILKFALFAANRPVPKRMDRKQLDEYRAQLSGLKLTILTTDKLDQFLASLPRDKAARTRNGYRTSVIGLFSFLVQKKKLVYNPMLSATRHRGEPKRRRRGLSAGQLQALFDVARRRPLVRTLTVHRGKNKGKEVAQISSETRRQRERDGLQRALVYMTAFYTGFRRKELRSMRVKHLQLDHHVPHVFLPGELTKNGEDTQFTLRPEFAARLRSWVDGKAPDEPIFTIPRYDELLKALKKDLAFAHIPYRDELGRVFDFHSLRKSRWCPVSVERLVG
jgi:integrase